MEILKVAKVFILASICAINVSGQVPDSIFLYNDVVSKIPNNEPCIFPYLMKSEKQVAGVLIFPGGGYRIHAMDHEGKKVAKWFNDRGVNAFIVKYRLGLFEGNGNLQPTMLNDAIRAMQYIRSNSKQFNIDPAKIGVIGFSAGGHLASLLSVHFEDKFVGRDDLDSTISAQPDFCILAYPVITMNDKYSHWGSRRFSLGTNPTKYEMDFYSSNYQVKPNTPPTFLFHTSDDKSVPVENSILYYLALREMGIPVEIHILEHGVHGVGLAETDPILMQWTELLETWLRHWGVIKK
jgi:acetyl esterase/lipase